MSIRKNHPISNCSITYNFIRLFFANWVNIFKGGNSKKKDVKCNKTNPFSFDFSSNLSVAVFVGGRRPRLPQKSS